MWIALRSPVVQPHDDRSSQRPYVHPQGPQMGVHRVVGVAARSVKPAALSGAPADGVHLGPAAGFGLVMLDLLGEELLVLKHPVHVLELGYVSPR